MNKLGIPNIYKLNVVSLMLRVPYQKHLAQNFK